MSNRDKILSYRDLIKKKLIPLINADYVLLDVPNHPNIGDNLIWEGELRFLENIHYKCIYSANVHNWDENKIKDAKIIMEEEIGEICIESVKSIVYILQRNLKISA